ncbi:hypothetical protein F5051DRAFT_435894 [Lentinula edodes]|nr:hypothetical protein F5051DRAFT_435894 [Lentinula edodes]
MSPTPSSMLSSSTLTKSSPSASTSLIIAFGFPVNMTCPYSSQLHFRRARVIKELYAESFLDSQVSLDNETSLRTLCSTVNDSFTTGGAYMCTGDGGDGRTTFMKLAARCYWTFLISLLEGNVLAIPPLNWTTFEKFRSRTDTNNVNFIWRGKIRATHLIGQAMDRNQAISDLSLRELCFDHIPSRRVLDHAVPGGDGDTFLHALGDDTAGITDEFVLTFFSHLLNNISERSEEFNRVCSTTEAGLSVSDMPISKVQRTELNMDISSKHKRSATSIEAEVNLRDSKRTKTSAISKLLNTNRTSKKVPEEASIRVSKNSVSNPLVNTRANPLIPRSSTVSAGPLPSSSLRRVPVCGTSAASRPTARAQNSTNRSVSVVHRQAVYIDDSKPDSHKHSSRASAPSAFPSSESWVEDDLAHSLKPHSSSFKTTISEAGSLTSNNINDNDPTGSSTSGFHVETSPDTAEVISSRLPASSASLPVSSFHSALGSVTHALVKNVILPSVLSDSESIKPKLLDDTTVQLLSAAHKTIGALLAAHQAAVARGKD